MANTDIIPDSHKIDIGTIGAISDLTTFQKSAVQGERFLAVDAKRMFIATTSAALSDSDVREIPLTSIGNSVLSIIGINVESPTNKTYTFILYSQSAWTIHSLISKTSSGTCTVNIQIDGVSVTSLSAVSVNNVKTVTDATALNDVFNSRTSIKCLLLIKIQEL